VNVVNTGDTEPADFLSCLHGSEHLIFTTHARYDVSELPTRQ